MGERTSRGFRIDSFVDRYGKVCSLQESSLAGEEGHIWLGVDDPEDARMHLSQSQVRDLLPALEHFAATGRLPA